MEAVAKIPVDLEPRLDQRRFDAELSKLEKSLRSMRSGAHSSTSALAARLMKNLIDTGQATTPTQARMILTDRMGGGFGRLAMSNLRVGQNITASQLYSQRVAQLEQKRLTGLSFRAAGLSSQYQAFQQQPTGELATGLLAGLTSIRRELLKLYQEYRVNRRQVPPILRQIAQNTSSMKREVSDWDSQQPQSESGSNNLIVLAKKLTGIASVASGAALLFKKGTQAITSALQRGAQAMRLKAAYGGDVDWRDVRARAGIFNMSEETAASTSQYASDFRQRMLWGEVSEREIIGLSRAGRWGRMVMSGEAQRNPVAANQAFEELVSNTDQAKMRSILRQLGLSQELMNYNIQGYDTATRQEYNEKFAEIADKEWKAAVMMYDAGNQYQVFTQQLSEVLATFAAENVQALSPQGRAFARNLGVNSATKMATDAEKFATQSMFSKENQRSFWSMQIPEPRVPFTNANMNVTVNNNMNVNGNVDMNNIDEIANQMNAATSKAMYNEMAKSIPGMRTGF